LAKWHIFNVFTLVFVAIFVKIFGHEIYTFDVFSKSSQKLRKIKWAEPGIIGQVFSKIKRP